MTLFRLADGTCGTSVAGDWDLRRSKTFLRSVGFGVGPEAGEPDSTPSGDAVCGDEKGWVVGSTVGRVDGTFGDGAGRVVGPTDGWFNSAVLGFGVGSTVGIVVVGSNGDETTGGTDANPFVGPGDG